MTKRTSASKQPTETIQEQRKRMKSILRTLTVAYPDARVGLDYTNEFELLIATILSAQCTDERVNQVGATLFSKYKSPTDFLRVDIEELEQDIRPTGFYKNKAKHIRSCCEMLVETFNSQVPQRLEDLIRLPGVGRKTANCVLSNCYSVPAITVDTHVTRLSNLLGFVTTENAERIEIHLMNITQEEQWNTLNLLFITHGRRTCIARRPKCAECSIAHLCPSVRLL